MTDQLSGCEADKVLDAPIRTIVECGLELFPPGPLRTLLIVLICLCVVLFPFIYKYYLGVLAQGAAPEGSLERQDYDKLRAGLAGGNLAARLYAKWLTAFLDWIERFFGDVGLASRTPFLPRFLRLGCPAPLWTAPAFDRCLLLATILACLGNAAGWLRGEGVSDSLVLFLGLLTLLNAPFDWASLGLTRALLRRGLELGGWWPYLLALVDAALAAVIIALLALTLVLGVQAFDELAVHGGGKSVLPLDALFDGIAKNPAWPEYWWVYALLLSSMIPSLINLMISGMAFTRGIPWLARRLLQWIPEGKAVPEYKRQPAAIGLTVQMFAGAGLGIAAQALLAWGLIFHVLPWIGLDLLDMARAVAAFDVPLRAYQLFAGIL